MKAAYSVCIGIVILLVAVGVVQFSEEDSLVAGFLPNSQDMCAAGIGAVCYILYTLLQVPIDRMARPQHQRRRAGLDAQHPCQSEGSFTKSGTWQWYFLWGRHKSSRIVTALERLSFLISQSGNAAGRLHRGHWNVQWSSMSLPRAVHGLGYFLLGPR